MKATSDPDTVVVPVGRVPQGGEAGLLLSRGRGIHPDRTRDDWELILVRSGRLPITEEGVDRSVGPDEALLLPPGRRHRGTATYAPDLAFHWLHFRPAPGGASVRLPARSRPADVVALRSILHAYIAGGAALHPLAAGGLVLQALACLVPGQAAPVAPALVARAEAVIAKRFHEPISTQEVADALDVHPDHLARVWRSWRGGSVLAAIQARRIEDARRLLLETDWAQERIAGECGFADVRWFRRVFRRAVGLSPGDWRDRHAGGHVNAR